MGFSRLVRASWPKQTIIRGNYTSMFIDMHVHSVSSDDSQATVEQYLKWTSVIRKKGHNIDGIVLTEHRKFDSDKDYSELAAKYDVVVLRGSELDTRFGHFLVYGVNDHLMRKFNFADVNIDSIELMREARASGAIALPAHPGRVNIGLCDFIENGHDFSDVFVVEVLNGGSRTSENERAAQFAAKNNYFGTGGSDAHSVSALGTYATEFPDRITTEEALVDMLYKGTFHAVTLAQTVWGGTSIE